MPVKIQFAIAGLVALTSHVAQAREQRVKLVEKTPDSNVFYVSLRIAKELALSWALKGDLPARWISEFIYN